MSPVLSIVIVNYNYGRFLESAIKSVLTQKVQGVELIVVDGGSSDESVSIIRRHERDIAWWVSERDNGQSEAFNKGFSHAKGKYLTWLNADDVLTQGCLHKVVQELTRHPDWDWFTANSYRFSDADGSILEIAWGPHWYPNWLQRKNSPIVAFGPSTIFSKALYERVGKIDESLHYVMDSDLWVRFMAAGVKQRRINEFVWGFRMHGDSKTAEFGDHKLDAKTFAKLQEETKYSFERVGYSMSPILHAMVRMWRLLDGSFIARWRYQRNFKQVLNSEETILNEVQILKPHNFEGLFFYQQWLCEAWKKCGGHVIEDFSVPRKIRAAFGRLCLRFPVGRHPRKLLICVGSRAESVGWPWWYRYELIPIAWDVWPADLDALMKFVGRIGVKTLFCTSSQTAERMREQMPGVRAVWLPEGVDVEAYPKGGPLVSRPIDIIEYGRRMKPVHDSIVSYAFSHPIRHVYRKDEPLKPFHALVKDIRDSKISICYPQCDTSPDRAGNIETLTQRYWEGMLSGTLIVGRAPKELIELCGYNPVVVIDKDNPAADMERILMHIEDYQELVDRNERFARANAPWERRVRTILETLNEG